MANKRREKGAGSIRKIGAKYYGRLMIDGVTKNFVGDSAADVRRQMREYDPEREEKERNNPLVTDYMQTWLTTYKKPSDYDAEAHTLHVHQTARKYRTRDKAGALQQGITVQYGRPKTRAGTRIVPCDTIAQQAVQELIRRAKAARSPFLVVSKAGTPTTITLLEHAAERIFRRIGAEGATLHSLRHTFASQLFAAGVDVLTISRTLGHASTAITMQVYVHMTAESQEAAAAKIEAALSSI